MKLLVPVLLLLAAASAEAVAADPCTSTDVNNRKMKLTVHGGFKHPHLEKEPRAIQHQLLEDPNSVRNAAMNSGAFAHDAARGASGVDSNVDQATDPTVAGRNGSKNDYRSPGGAGLDSHHTIDLQTWNKQHPPKPDNKLAR